MERTGRKGERWRPISRIVMTPQFTLAACAQGPDVHPEITYQHKPNVSVSGFTAYASWADYKQCLKKNLADGRRHAQQISGGPAEDLTPLEERASGVLSEESLVGVGRIDAGCDPALTRPLSPPEREAEAEREADEGAVARSEVGVPAHDVDAPQNEAARLLRQQTLSHISHHFESKTQTS
ncbi:uncharacterized protein LOC142138689 isoform X2 [Mixophyes fleayi]|uniref:uncharacterized protein LOC142138689 isoform X2 n=1 Tax=Mixophyes fleayi TaxID=3061075 RepID=UPI003F4DBD21